MEKIDYSLAKCLTEGLQSMAIKRVKKDETGGKENYWRLGIFLNGGVRFKKKFSSKVYDMFRISPDY